MAKGGLGVSPDTILCTTRARAPPYVYCLWPCADIDWKMVKEQLYVYKNWQIWADSSRKPIVFQGEEIKRIAAVFLFIALSLYTVCSIETCHLRENEIKSKLITK